ncbi:hypothetical protein K3495_g4130 [Podosphaera aphanis]|nr:hypothetical protein K3495_g4130 [Podosphaera aphanis]
MRGKRSKQYRKLMQHYGLSYGFREPYQVILDADIIKDADKFKMDLVGGLERTLQGQVKPMITQCSMRHLYASSSEPGVSYLIDKAKTYERRRCGHLPSDYAEPLSAQECISSVVDPKSSGHNKHRYVVASQNLDVRKAMRLLMGVPLIYINRSVMIMEPMAEKSIENRVREEQGKFRSGLKRGSGSLKRKRSDEDGNSADIPKKKRSEKGPNPLAVKKPKSKQKKNENSTVTSAVEQKSSTPADSKVIPSEESEEKTKRKRKRKHKSTAVDLSGEKTEATTDAQNS